MASPAWPWRCRAAASPTRPSMPGRALRCCSRRQARARRWSLFPELGLSAYTCDDLFHQRALLDGCEAALARVVAASAALPTVAIVGLPLRVDHPLFNCAAVVQRGRLLGVVPKTYLPNYGEFYEARQFNPADHAQSTELRLLGQDVPFGAGLLFEASDFAHFKFHVEICEDLWVPIPPSSLCRARRRNGAVQPVGVEHHDRQIGLPARAGRGAVGALPGRVSVCVGRPGRIHHRPGLGRPGADLRKRPAAGRVTALCHRVAQRHRRRRPGAAGARADAPDQLRPVGGAPCRATGAACARCASSSAWPLRRRPRCAAAWSASPTCRRMRHRATTLPRGLRHPGAGADAAPRRPAASRRS